MPFCNKCGNQLAAGTKFCGNCGTAVMQQTTQQVQIKPIEPATDSQEKRKQIYVGEVRKCPNCGAVIGSLQAICSECGHELSNNKIDDSINEFFTTLSKISSEEDTSIDTEKRNMYTLSKTLLVLVSFLCFGTVVFIPVGIILIVTFILLPPFMGIADKKKKNLIETFVIPNNKESLLEFLMLSASQIQTNTNPFIKTGKENRRWNAVWKTKIKQVIAKTNVTLANDTDAIKKIETIKKEFNIK